VAVVQRLTMVPLNQGQLFAARAMIQAVKVTGQAIATCLR